MTTGTPACPERPTHAVRQPGSLQTGRRWPADLPGTVEVYQSTCLVALGRPARGAVGALPDARAVPLTSNADINRPGRRRHTAANGARGEPRPSRGGDRTPKAVPVTAEEQHEVPRRLSTTASEASSDSCLSPTERYRFIEPPPRSARMGPVSRTSAGPPPPPPPLVLGRGGPWSLVRTVWEP